MAEPIVISDAVFQQINKDREIILTKDVIASAATIGRTLDRSRRDLKGLAQKLKDAYGTREQMERDRERLELIFLLGYSLESQAMYKAVYPRKVKNGKSRGGSGVISEADSDLPRFRRV